MKRRHLIRYGINRVVRCRGRRTIQHAYGTYRPRTWPAGHDEQWARIRRVLRRKHPGWAITGYSTIA